MTQTPQTAKFSFPAPTEFEGEKNKARTWIMECELYFAVPHVAAGLDTDQQKILFCLIKMKGKAEPWKRVKLTEYTRVIGGVAQWPTFNNFKTAFITAFGGEETSTKALTKLMTLKKRLKKDFDLYSHLTTLDTLFAEAGVTGEEQKMIHLQKTIPTEYRKVIQYDDFDSYQALIDKLKRIQKGDERRAFFDLPTPGGSTSGKDEWAMDVDRVNIGVFDQDSTQTCFRCGKKGHWMKDCYSKTKVNGTMTTGNNRPKTQGELWENNRKGGNNFNRNKGRGNFRGRGRGRGNFRGKGKGRVIRALEQDEELEEEEEEDEEIVPQTDMGISIRAAIKSLPKKDAEKVIADLQQGF
jgi:hypothetical protein